MESVAHGRARATVLRRLHIAWLGLRNRLIADPAFQRRAASLPFVRGIAARRARALFDICAGFVYSQVLLACVRLSLFEKLAAGPVDPTTLAPALNVPPEATDRLLRAAASLHLVQFLPDGRDALDDLGAALLGNPSVSAFVGHHALLYDDLRDPVGLLRGEVRTKLSGFWPYDDANGAHAAYSALMSTTQPLVARDILDAYPFDRHRCLMDVGGGEGGFLTSVAAACPNLQLALFDLPPVAERARRRLADLGLGARVTVTGGSFVDDALPSGADLISLVRVAHDHDDPTLRILLRRIFEALPSGGMLLVAEPMAGTQGAEPIGDAYFGFYLLAMGRGRARRPAELEGLLREAGFVRIQRLQTRRPLVTGAIVAAKS